MDSECFWSLTLGVALKSARGVFCVAWAQGEERCVHLRTFLVRTEPGNPQQQALWEESADVSPQGSISEVKDGRTQVYFGVNFQLAEKVCLPWLTPGQQATVEPGAKLKAMPPRSDLTPGVIFF